MATPHAESGSGSGPGVLLSGTVPPLADAYFPRELSLAGTLRRGGTRGGTATLLALAALAGAALAFVPVVGYLEALAVPALGVRLRRRAPERHAGLRSLAKD